jgi:hypothetical protein
MVGVKPCGGQDMLVASSLGKPLPIESNKCGNHRYFLENNFLILRRNLLTRRDS